MNLENLNFIQINENECNVINGGALAGSIFGGVMGFTGGAIFGTIEVINGGSQKDMGRDLYLGTLMGASSGLFLPF